LVGAYITFRARLSPPLEPLRPGSDDFARDLYFQGIGATGFVLGAIQPAAAPATPGLWLKYAAAVQGLRDSIDARIRADLPGDRGSIASALITGKRDAITTPVNDAMYISSLAHVLSISGYHMALVAGVVFFVLRAILALIPGFASARPIKKWSAIGALIGAFGYLLLSGSEVATQRSFIMTGIVLVGVMFDRPALTLRTLALAALGVLLLAPQSVTHPSFQMSFAATLALIAAYQRGLPWMSAGADTSMGGPRRAVGRPRDRRSHTCVDGCRSGDNALCSLPFSPACTVWRDRQPARHAGRIGLGDADGASRPTGHPVRLRRRVLAADG
jgi:competence protein ComEC